MPNWVWTLSQKKVHAGWPVEAIFLDADVPAKWNSFVQLNADRVRVLKPLAFALHCAWKW